jgi:hypothetical protein
VPRNDQRLRADHAAAAVQQVDHAGQVGNVGYAHVDEGIGPPGDGEDMPSSVFDPARVAPQSAEDAQLGKAQLGDGGAEAAPADSSPETDPPGDAAASAETAKGGSSTVAHSRLQTAIARRIAGAKATVPNFQIETEVRMDAPIALRAELNSVATNGPASLLQRNDRQGRRARPSRAPRANGFDATVRLPPTVVSGSADTAPALRRTGQRALRSRRTDRRRHCEGMRSARAGSLLPT